MATRKFLLKAAKGKDKFFMAESDEFLYFYSPTLKDLRATLRCILAKGYRVQTAPSLGKLINAHQGHLVGLSPFFGTTMFEVFEIGTPIEIKKEFDYENSFGFKHKLKLVDSTIAQNVC